MQIGGSRGARALPMLARPELWKWACRAPAEQSKTTHAVFPGARTKARLPGSSRGRQDCAGMGLERCSFPGAQVHKEGLAQHQRGKAAQRLKVMMQKTGLHNVVWASTWLLRGCFGSPNKTTKGAIHRCT
eukprot:1146872-Pelagomonas_calceolata.AAC.9